MNEAVEKLVAQIEEDANQQWEVIELTAKELSNLKGGEEDE